MAEQWKKITEYKTTKKPVEFKNKNYEISNYGNLKINGVLKKLKVFRDLNCVTLKDDSDKETRCNIHNMVANTFVNNDDAKNKIIINHIDGDLLNDRADNLKWITLTEHNKNKGAHNKAAAAKEVIKKKCWK